MTKIFVVDDDPFIHQLIAHYLKKMGYDLLAAEAGEEVVGSAIAEKPDLIFLDIEMPGEINGLDALELIKANNKTDTIPVIMLTARNDRSSVEKAMDLGAEDYIVKPFKTGALIGKMERLLSLKVQKNWKALKPIQEKILQTTLNSVNGINDWAVRKDGDPPFQKIKDAGVAIAEGVEAGEIDSVLEAVRHDSTEAFVHPIRVSTYLTMFARHLNQNKIHSFTTEEIQDFAIGGLMHDAGNVDVPLEILYKPDGLSKEKRKEMKKHIEYTKLILKKITDIRKITFEIATRHHERWDGKGYPQGMKGNDIGIPGKMAAIVDVFEALTAVKAYKKGMSAIEALQTMTKWEGHFDDKLLRHFKKLFLKNKEETVVEKEKGEVSKSENTN